MSEPKIVCVGASEETEAVLSALLGVGADVVALVTLPPSASATVSDYVDLRPVCNASGVAVISTGDINSPETLGSLRDLAPDYIYTLGWSQLFKDELIRLPTSYVVGSHPSDLPFGRGRAPIPWTILEGSTSSAVSLFRMDVGVDSGPILVKRLFDIPPGSNSRTLYDLMVENLSRAFVDLHQMHITQTPIVEIEQDPSSATYRAKRTPADGHLDFSRTAEEIDRLVRASTRPYPGAYAYYEGRVIRVWSSSLEDVPAYTGTTGQIMARVAGGILVQAADRPLWFLEMSEGDEPLDPQTLRSGKRFGYRVEDTLYRLEREVAEIKESRQ